MFDKITNFLEKTLQPVAAKLSQNVIINSISQGMLNIVCITVGVCIVSILVNLPFQPWLDFLQNIGIYNPARELVSATSSMLGIYVVISVAYSYAVNLGIDTRHAVLGSVGVFLLLMPQSVTVGDESVSALLSSNLGSNGIFIGIIVGLVVPGVYHFLIAHNVRIRMPEQVPPNVSNAMTPIFAFMIIFSGSLVVKWLFALTPFGDIYSFLSQVLMTPLMAVLGTSAITPIICFEIRALFWFFGIHPSPVNAVWLPIFNAAVAANIEAYMVDGSIPNLLLVITYLYGLIGGTGATLSLSFLMLRAKSERYKALSKVAIIPSIFNINEPIVFGLPIMYNPIMAIPTLLAPLAGGIIAWLSVALGFINAGNFNPAVSVAWVVPAPIEALLRGGLPYMISILLAILVQGVIFVPFFRVADNMAYQEENPTA